jgi:hypothetical protein
VITGAGAGPDHAGADVIRPGLMSLETREGEPAGPVGSELPQVFGRYLLVQRMSRGGMGEIFLAKHGLAGFEKLAVIKKILPNLSADAQFTSRFVDEAQVAIKLSHVNIAQVFEVGRVGDEYFLALEHVDGRDLRRTFAALAARHQRMPVELALLVGRDIANGLAYAHRRTGADGASLALVHCDISPPNVLVSFEGETKIIDFGIARSALRATASDPSMGFGKFGYMAPEQLLRGGVIDHRTDIYAAGVVLYELLTGLRLYEAGPSPDFKALARAVARGEHPIPSQCDPALAPFDDLVIKALRPAAADRYQTAAELRDAIQTALVAVNPTVSADHLGAFMRDVFAAEIVAQREAADRIAHAHLADYQEALSTQAIETVSFALAGASAATTGTAPPPAPVVVAAPVALPAPAAPAQVASGTQPLSGTDLVEVSELGALAPAADLHRPSTARRSEQRGRPGVRTGRRRGLGRRPPHRRAGRCGAGRCRAGGGPGRRQPGRPARPTPAPAGRQHVHGPGRRRGARAVPRGVAGVPCLQGQVRGPAGGRLERAGHLRPVLQAGPGRAGQEDRQLPRQDASGRIAAGRLWWRPGNAYT